MGMLIGHGPTPGMFKGAIDGGDYLWVSPTYKQIENSKIWRDLKRVCIDAVATPNDIREGSHEIRLINGATIRVMSADGEDSLRGPGLDGLIIDEASRVSMQVWTEVLRPALADKQGWAMFLTTPNGKNWFYKMFQEAKKLADWECWQLPTAENPIVKPEELEKIRTGPNSSPRVFAQEHLAEFTEIEGALFPSHYFDDHIWAGHWPDAFELSAIAVDPSLGEGDPSAIVFAGLCGGLLYVSADVQLRPPEQIVDDTIRMFQRFQPNVVAVETIGFAQLFIPNIARRCQDLQVPPLPLHPIDSQKASKAIRIASLDPHLANHWLRFMVCDGCHTLIEQLQMFPDKGHHDDGPDALAMCVAVMNQIAVGVR